jgi:hypothetical protein
VTATIFISRKIVSQPAQVHQVKPAQVHQVERAKRDRRAMAIIS